MKLRTRKQQREQDEARNILSPMPAVCSALLCRWGWKGVLGTEGFDFSKVALALGTALGTSWGC